MKSSWILLPSLLLAVGVAVSLSALAAGSGAGDAHDHGDKGERAKEASEDDDEPEVAYAEIEGCRGEGRLGRAVLVELPSDQGIKTVLVTINVRGLTPGSHAVHIHENGVCEPCGAAGGHFDPGPNSNSSPDGNHPFHMGDLVNIKVDSKGRGRLRTKTTRVTLSPGPLSVFDADGSAFIIHDNEDTFCPEGADAGCAGGTRAACGIIRPM